MLFRIKDIDCEPAGLTVHPPPKKKLFILLKGKIIPVLQFIFILHFLVFNHYFRLQTVFSSYNGMLMLSLKEVKMTVRYRHL